MTTISRRHALAGGTAAIAAAAVLPSMPAMAGDLDAELYQALSEYHAKAAAYDAVLETNSRIYKSVQATFPEIERWANFRHGHTGREAARECQICNDLEAACEPSRDEFTAALQEAGWDSSEGDAEHAAKMASYDRAMVIPAHTIEGLWQKVETIDREFVYDEDTEVAIGRSDWYHLAIDIRRLAGEAQS